MRVSNNKIDVFVKLLLYGYFNNQSKESFVNIEDLKMT